MCFCGRNVTPPRAQSGVVAETKRDRAVSRLVECNFDNRLKRPDRDRAKQRAKLLHHLTRCMLPLEAWPRCRRQAAWPWLCSLPIVGRHAGSSDESRSGSLHVVIFSALAQAESSNESRSGGLPVVNFFPFAQSGEATRSRKVHRALPWEKCGLVMLSQISRIARHRRLWRTTALAPERPAWSAIRC
jgi:hypothetical protein